MMLLTSCSYVQDKDYYIQNLGQYYLLSDYIRDNYEIPGHDERLLIELNDMEPEDTSISKALSTVKERFGFVWLSENEIVYWNDETKTLGLLDTADIKKSRQNLDWYDGLEYAKLDDRFYVIGQLNHI